MQQFILNVLEITEVLKVSQRKLIRRSLSLHSAELESSVALLYQ